MSLLLNVDYAEKDEARALGAKWNPELKRWYVDDKNNYPKFKKWILKEKDSAVVVFDYFYIIEGKHNCFKCGKETKVIGFGLENYIQIYNDEESISQSGFERFSGEINIASSIEPLSPELLAYLKEKYNYYLGYSKTTKSDYYANHCNYCNVLQGDFYLFNEIDSPFSVDSIERAKGLILHKIILKNDLILEADIGYGSEDHLIKDYGQIDVLNPMFY